MARRQTNTEGLAAEHMRGVFVGKRLVRGCRSVKSKTRHGEIVSFRAAVPVARIQDVVNALWDELDVIDPEPDASPPASFGLGYLRLI